MKKYFIYATLLILSGAFFFYMRIQIQEIRAARPLPSLSLQADLDAAPAFDETEWTHLVKEHQASPCLEQLSHDCLTEQVFSLLGIPGKPAAHSDLSVLAEIAIDLGDRKSADMLLKAWPSEDAVRREEESASGTPRDASAKVDDAVFRSYTQYMRLLFLSGAYEKGEKILTELQERKKSGDDYRIISTLVKAKDYDAAFRIAKRTLEWKRETPDPNRGSSAILHCNFYRESRPEGMGRLAIGYIQAGELDKAYEVAKFLRHYWENKAFGQESFCYIAAAEKGFVRAMKALFGAHNKQGNKQEARRVFKELISVLQMQTKHVNESNKTTFERLAKLAATNAPADELNEIAAFVETHDETRYFSVTNDPASLIYALAGQYQKAFDIIESPQPPRQDNPRDTLYEELGMKEAPRNDVRLTTYLETAKALSETGDKKGALLFLEKASPHIGVHNPGYDATLENLSDYIDKAHILMDLGEKQQSRRTLDEALHLVSQTTPQDARGVKKMKSYYGQLAILYARHENMSIVQDWADKLPFYYSGFFYARLAEMLIKEKRWQELDGYLGEMARVFSTDGDMVESWQRFTDALIKEQEFDRYMRFFHMTDKRNDADRQRQGIPPRAPVGDNTPETPDSRRKVWLVTELLVAQLKDRNVPSNVIKDVWPIYIKNCRMWAYILPRHGRESNISLSATETMAACYLGLVKKKIDREPDPFDL